MQAVTRMLNLTEIFQFVEGGYNHGSSCKEYLVE